MPSSASQTSMFLSMNIIGVGEVTPLNYIVLICMEDDEDNHLTSKKRAKKQRTVLAAEALGFEKPELPVIDLSPRRVKKKPVVGNSEVEQFQRLFNFRSKFRLVVDADEVSEQQAKHFDGTCINEWLLVQQVVFTASENLPIQCPICHNDKYEICAPKITPCGHVFCWTCILRFLKLSNCQRVIKVLAANVLSA